MVILQQTELPLSLNLMIRPLHLCNDTTIYLDAAGTASVDAAGMDDGSYDVCGAVTLSLDITSFDCNDIGANTVTLTVEDDNSNTSTCQATVTVVRYPESDDHLPCTC